MSITIRFGYSKGYSPLTPLPFLKERETKNFQKWARWHPSIKSKTVGTDEVSDGFLPRLNYTSVESETDYSVL